MRPATTRPIFEPLEQRLLYSADFSPAALAGFGTPEFGEQRLLQTEDTAVAAHASLEIAFVDMSLPDAEGLISDLLAQRSTGRPIEVVRIGSDEDGIARIGEALDGRSGITAVHVLSHGSDGAVQLGNAQLDANTLLARAGALSRWGSALSGDADLLLYGCDVAASEIGAQMVANLAVLTGADVAASTDLTGAASRGGDWSLEHRTGEIAATTAPSFAARSEWQGLMATFNVTSTGDSIILGSLRWAITQANLSLGSDTIVLGPGTYTLSVPNLLLPDDANLTGDLDIAGDVSIVGAGAGSTVIDGNGLDRVFDVRNGDVSFSGLTIQGGATSDDGGAVRVAAGASASLSQSILQGNSADKGGAIASDGMLSLSDVEIRSNDASNDGGGILISGGSATLDRVTLADNQAQKGGAIHLKGAVLSLTNVTASGNTASNEGGALFLEGDTSLLNATVANNTASKDGGLSIHGGGTLVTLKNTLLANNGGGNVGGAVTSLGHNLSTDGSASLSQPTDLSSTAASIGVLADNGGFTRTHALLAGSAALNTGDSLAAPATDQRGAARDGAADIGAFEAASPPTISVIADQATTEDTPVGPIAFTVGDAETAAGGLIVSASSSNASIIAPAGLVFGGSGANRTLTVTPVANASGAPVTITLNVSDGAQTTSTTFTVTVGAVNDAPLVSAIALGSINEDASRLITQADLLAGASDIEGDALSAVNLSLTAGSGALIDNGNGTWTFTPAVDWNGAASFSFGVSDGSVTVANSASLTVSAVNDAPVIAAIGLGSINEDASRLITQADLLAGASDVDGGALSAVNLALASGNGVVLDNGNGTWTFTSAPNWNGAASFSFGVSDGGVTVANTATLAVAAVNDPATVAAIDLGSTNEDTSRLITQADLLAGASDVEGDALSAVNLSLAAGSGALVDNGNGTWTFTPAADWNGAASFSFGVSDGSVAVANSASLTVSAINDAPAVAAIDFGATNEDASRLVTQADLLAGASDVDGGALSAVNLTLASGSGALVDNGNGTWTFKPTPNWNGAASFSFGVTDGTSTVANSATLALMAINDAPVVAAIALGSISEDASRLITQADLLAAATDVDGDALRATNLSLTSGSGALVDNGNGTWTFTPAANWNGAASFSFGVFDGSGTVANSASLTVSAVNDAPVAARIDLGPVDEDTSRLITQAELLAGATDAEGAALLAKNLQLKSTTGTLVDNGNGTWTYTPKPDWNGAVAFAFDVSDGVATSSTQAVLDVRAVNDAPVITSDGGAALADVKIAENSTAATSVTATDADAATVIRFAIAGGADAARFTIDAETGKLAFVRAPDHEQPADTDADNRYEVIVSATDGNLTAQQLLRVEVGNVDEAPAIVANSLQVSGSGVTLVLRGVDTDSAAGVLEFNVTAVAGGRFEHAAAPGQAITTFTQADIDAGAVRFVPDDGAAAIDYRLSLSDGVSTVTSAAPDVVFTLAPQPVAAAPAAAPPPAPAPEVPGVPARNGADPESTPVVGTTDSPLPAAPDLAMPSVADRAGAPPIDVAPVEFEPMRTAENVSTTLAATSAALRSLDAPVTAFDVRFSLPSEDGVAFEPRLPQQSEVAEALRDIELAEQLDRVRDDVTGARGKQQEIVASTLMLSTGLSVGYVLWLGRGGVLLASLLSALPAWSTLDPLPVLAQVRRRDEQRDDEATGDDDPIEKLFSKARQLLAPGAAYMKGLSSRFHLAVGMMALVVSVLLLALHFGLVPDRDQAVRAGRLALAESVALGSAELVDDEDESRLRRLLRLVVRRNPELLSIGIRQADGELWASTGDHVVQWRAPAAGISTETQVVLPILRESQRWGQAELRYAPLHAASAWGPLASPPIKLIVAVGLACFALFYLYLRRMLRHLDPSSSIPGRVRTAFDTLAEGLLVLDPKGHIVLANHAFSAVVGQRSDELIGRPATTLAWNPHAETPWTASLADARARHNVVMTLPDAQGRRRTFMVNCSPVPGAGGKPAGVLVSFDDVTELEEKEIELRVARDEAEAANRAKSDFLANMSHEIRTPMNAILGFTELLRRGDEAGSGDARRHLDIIRDSGKHLLELINDILDLSKVEAGRIDVERVQCEAHRVVQDVVRVMNVRAEEKGVGLRVEFSEALPARVLTDASRLRQIVTNLVGNALKFTQRGEVRVVMRMVRDGGPAHMAIDIIDTGIGIAADKLEAVFEPFVQAEASTTRQFGGTGLGLAISRRFARALGGDVTATSVPGQGSTFRVTIETGALDGVEWLLPQALEAATVAAAAVEQVAWAFPAARVLVVDDGAENRELVRLVLEAAGLAVIEAEHGQQALDQIAQQPVDLVLMDVQMPVMDGYTATRTLRARGHTMPILALTANVMKGFESDLEAAGFSGYLAKPVDIDAMVADLAARLGGRRIEPTVTALPAAAAETTTPPAQQPIVSRLASHPRLHKVVRSFAQQLPAKLQAMQAALERRDLAELAQLAHWLKGAGGTVGFDAFFEPARKLEQHAKTGAWAELRHALQQLRLMADRIAVPDHNPAV